ncbi:MAG TPA: peptidylprolyl isomerase [Ktedonobacterales bacterium]|jgi:cyclophilin family peptidyl-prolyl cis-trans isomerase
MPNSATKRAQSRQAARVQRAHQTEAAQPVVRRAPAAKRNKRSRPTGFAGFIRQYRWAISFLLLLTIGIGAWALYANHLGPFAPKPFVAKCNLSTHMCDKPTVTLDPTKDYTATIKTAKGDIVIHLDAKNSPQTVNNFVYLSQQRYYDGSYFWRVETPGKPSPLDPSGQPSTLSLIQGGSVQDDGDAGKDYPGYTIPDELKTAQSGGYKPGVVAMANKGADTGAAQFFINTGDNTQYFNPTYSVFGEVTSGLDVAQKIEPKDKIESITIKTTALPTPAPTETPK